MNQNNIVEGIDYKFIHVAHLPRSTCVEIMTGKFKGVQYYYDFIKIPDEINESAEEVMINFAYEVVEYGELDSDSIRENTEFEVLLGAILNNLLYKAVESFSESGPD